MSTYPSPPSLRMGYDRDGTIGFYFLASGSTVNAISAGDMRKLNGEFGDAPAAFGESAFDNRNWCIGFLFPHKRDLIAYWTHARGDLYPGTVSGNLDVSANTTTGQDGNWTTIASPWTDGIVTGAVVPPDTDPRPWYRNSIVTLGTPATGIIAVRFTIVGAQGAGINHLNFEKCHLYGYTSAADVFDRLAPWHPTLNQQADGTTGDLGDIGRGTTGAYQFRIKNLSASKKAVAPLVADEALADASPTLIGQYQYSLDNVHFANTITLADIPAGAISPIIYRRNNVASAAALSLWALRTVVIASSWV